MAPKINILFTGATGMLLYLELCNVELLTESETLRICWGFCPPEVT
jgi:hypothetical protein